MWAVDEVYKSTFLFLRLLCQSLSWHLFKEQQAQDRESYKSEGNQLPASSLFTRSLGQTESPPSQPLLIGGWGTLWLFTITCSAGSLGSYVWRCTWSSLMNRLWSTLPMWRPKQQEIQCHSPVFKLYVTMALTIFSVGSWFWGLSTCCAQRGRQRTPLNTNLKILITITFLNVMKIPGRYETLLSYSLLFRCAHGEQDGLALNSCQFSCINFLVLRV